MPEAPDDIPVLLRRAQQGDPLVAEFAWIWLDAYRRDLRDVLLQHRQEGRTLALRGDDPDAARRHAADRLATARRRLLGRLRRLLAWAEESGRASGTER